MKNNRCHSRCLISSVIYWEYCFCHQMFFVCLFCLCFCIFFFLFVSFLNLLLLNFLFVCFCFLLMFLFNWFPVHHQYYSVLILLTIFYSYYGVFVRNLLNEFPIHLSTLSNVMANLTILDNIGQCCTKQYHSSTWLKFCVVDKIKILFITSEKPEDWQNTFFFK